MTVIIETVDTIAAADATTTVQFAAAVLRDSDDDSAMITTAPVRVSIVDGVLTTPDLDPGPAVVTVGLKSYAIIIPDSGTPIRLWPLIQAALPAPPTQTATAVINGGDAARIQVLTAAEYTTLVATTTPDPGSIFLVF